LSSAPDTAALPSADRTARIAAIAASQPAAAAQRPAAKAGQAITPSGASADIAASRVRPK